LNTTQHANTEFGVFLFSNNMVLARLSSWVRPKNLVEIYSFSKVLTQAANLLGPLGLGYGLNRPSLTTQPFTRSPKTPRCFVCLPKRQKTEPRFTQMKTSPRIKTIWKSSNPIATLLGLQGIQEQYWEAPSLGHIHWLEASRIVQGFGNNYPSAKIFNS
jgi:hypothetical protein